MTNTISGVKEKLLQKALLMLYNLLLFFMFLFVLDRVLEYESSSISDRYIIKKEIYRKKRKERKATSFAPNGRREKIEDLRQKFWPSTYCI